MRSTKPFGLKVVALGGAVLCLATFVAYRAGAFAGRVQPAAPAPSPLPSQPEAASDQPAKAPTFISGSKSFIIVNPSAVPPGTPPASTGAPSPQNEPASPPK